MDDICPGQPGSPGRAAGGVGYIATGNDVVLVSSSELKGEGALPVMYFMFKSYKPAHIEVITSIIFILYQVKKQLF